MRDYVLSMIGVFTGLLWPAIYNRRTSGGPPPAGSALLLENGSYLLLEDGTSHLLLE